MKIYINRSPRSGPWGGGAKAVNRLVSSLTQKGHDVVHRLEEGIDLIFCFDPRPNKYGEDFHHMLKYKQDNSIKIIQRVGDVGSHGKPDLTKYVEFCLDKSDFFIFPSTWAKDKIGFKKDNYAVIYNTPMKDFYKNRKKDKEISNRPKIVTHHWSTNVRKGFSLYKKFDEYCQETEEFKFYYIGQVPSGTSFERYYPPLDTSVLSSVLPEFDIYLTASEEEAGANHVLEAMAAGLPVIYTSNGGSIVEYCEGYGESYDDFDKMINSIRKVTQEYSEYKNAVCNYKCTNDQTIDKYCEIIEDILNES